MCVAKEGGKAVMNEEKTTAGSLALRERQPRVITIAAAQQPEDIKLRVAAYARVSSSSEDQLNSFAAQNRYYTTLISGKESWAMVDIYADAAVIIGLKTIRLKKCWKCGAFGPFHIKSANRT